MLQLNYGNGRARQNLTSGYYEFGMAFPLLPAELEARAFVALMMSSDRVSGAKRP